MDTTTPPVDADHTSPPHYRNPGIRALLHDTADAQNAQQDAARWLTLTRADAPADQDPA